MTADAILAELGQLPLFRGLGPSALGRLASACRERRVRANEIIFREGQRCDAFFLVRQGQVRIYRVGADGREQVMHRVGPGRTFAEAALFHHGVFPAFAVAEATPTHLLRIDGPRLLAWLAEDPALATGMVGSLCAWLHTLLDRIEVLTTVSAGARLAHYLLRLPARGEQDALTVELPLAKKALAAELSITPETLSRVLARWRERGWVTVRGRSVCLREPGALEVVAGEGRP